MKTSKKIFVAAFAVSILCNLIAVKLYFRNRQLWANQAYLNSHPHGNNDSLITYTFNKYTVNKAMLDLFNELPHSKKDIVFVGTSLTQGFPLQEMLGDARLKNRGIGGNTTGDILNRIDETFKGKPQKLFLEAGTNDFGKLPLDSIFFNIKTIFSRIKSGSPTTQLYYFSVLPFGKNQGAKITKLNDMVSKYCKSEGITFINLYPLFEKNGALNEQYTVDGTHLNVKGYFIWKSALNHCL